MDMEEEPMTKWFLELLQSLNLHQHVTKPTHKAGHILDLVITNNDESSICTVQVETCHFSDHDAVTFALTANKPKPIKKKHCNIAKPKTLTSQL